MALRAVLFDLDGTLVDSAPAIAAALSDVRANRGLEPLGAEAARLWISLGAAELVRRGLGPAAGDAAEDLAAFRRALTARPFPPDGLYPGVRGLLAGLRSAGLRLAIVTNKPEVLARRLLEELDLADSFGAIVGGDSAAACKPDPAPSLAALRALGVAPEGAAFVGDSRIDAEAAAALELPFHLFEGGYGAAECAGVRTASRFVTHSALLKTLVQAAVPRTPTSA